LIKNRKKAIFFIAIPQKSQFGGAKISCNNVPTNGVCWQISQEELAKAQQQHVDVDMETEIGLRTRMDDLHRELSEVRVSTERHLQ